MSLDENSANSQEDTIEDLAKALEEQDRLIERQQQQQQQQLSQADQEQQIPPPELLICVFSCTEQNVLRCRKCNRPFCVMHANVFSPNFCKDCFKDLAIVSERFKQTFDHISKQGQLYHEVREHTRYYLDGPDWPFIHAWIHELTDDQLKSLWVFHHFVMRDIEVENETRRIEYNRKQREKQETTRFITQSSTSKTGTKIKRTVVKDTPEAIRAKLKKQGIPETVIEQMIKAMSL